MEILMKTVTNISKKIIKINEIIKVFKNIN